MSDASPTHGNEPATLAREPALPIGRLATLSFLGAAAGVIPLPFVPSRMLTNVRGSIAHDVTTRHGLSLTDDARRVLAAADSPDPRRARLMAVANFVAGRLLKRMGPMWLLTPALTAIETFALGHLLNRYIEQVRESSTIRIQGDEARRIRQLIDRSLLRSLSPEVAPQDAPRPHSVPEEDDRDDLTRLTDWALLSTASAPSYIVRRLEAAFDDLTRQQTGTH